MSDSMGIARFEESISSRAVQEDLREGWARFGSGHSGDSEERQEIVLVKAGRYVIGECG